MTLRERARATRSWPGERGAVVRSVRVATTARLHLGFLDLNGDLGRRFGSIGLSIDAFETVVEVVSGARFETRGLERERSATLATRTAGALGVTLREIITVASAIPAHSGTRLRDAARACDRGARCGVSTGSAPTRSGMRGSWTVAPGPAPAPRCSTAGALSSMWGADA